MTTPGLRVAVTGPTGDIGYAFVSALDRAPEVERIVAMARRPFDPAEHGWTKVEYRRGDIRDPDEVERLVEGADVVVHLAFMIFGTDEQTRAINVEGSCNVFAAAFDSKAARLVYTSSVAAYGFHEENPQPLTEDVPLRGTDGYPYSQQKAELERELNEMAEGRDTDVYVFRPCIVAGANALSMIREIPLMRVSEKIPEPVRKVGRLVPALRPIVPDPGVAFQLVHEDDVASALVAATVGAGPPGVYNLAGPGTITVRDVAEALGWYSVPVPDIALDATVKVVSRLPYLPARAALVNAVRVPVLMDTIKARRDLGWEPRHDALETLADTVNGARAKGLIHRPG